MNRQQQTSKYFREAKRLQEAMDGAELGAARLAALVGIDLPRLSNYLSGISKAPTDIANIMAPHLGVTAAWLLLLDDTENQVLADIRAAVRVSRLKKDPDAQRLILRSILDSSLGVRKSVDAIRGHLDVISESMATLSSQVGETASSSPDAEAKAALDALLMNEDSQSPPAGKAPPPIGGSYGKPKRGPRGKGG